MGPNKNNAFQDKLEIGRGTASIFVIWELEIKQTIITMKVFDNQYC